jgi:hypothetical protein
MPFESRISFAAESPPVTGSFHARGDIDDEGPIAPFAFEGEVTCLLVDDHQASLKYVIENAQGSGEGFEGQIVQIFIEDNGEPAGGEPVDRAAFRFPQIGDPVIFPTLCELPIAGATYDRIESGDFTVHDAAP